MKIQTQRWIDHYVGTIICGLFSVVYKVFKKEPRPNETKRILIILLSEMGALVLGYPMFQRLKAKFPEASLNIIVFEKNREVVELLGIIPSENIITINDRSMPVFIKSAFGALTGMRRLNIDTVIDCELFSRISSILSFLSGAAIRIGFHPHTQEGLYRGNFINCPVLYNPYHHISEQFLTLVDAIDSATDPKAKRLISKDRLEIPAMEIGPGEIENAKYRLYEKAPAIREKKIVLIYPGGGLLPIRAWPLDYYCSLAEALLQRGYAVCVIGLAEDKPVARKILSRTQNENCVDLTGYTKTIRELMGIFHLASLLITNDGGPGHFAAMTPVPTIIFYGPETPLLYGPIDEKAQNLFLGLSCSPCVTAYNHRNSPCDGDNQCLKMIEPEYVLERALDILEP
jgi:lipopolysaccharide heptosyltransferase II